MNTDDASAPEAGQNSSELSPAALTALTAEHYNLQSQRGSTIAETNGRASIFLGAVSAGLIAIGFSLQAETDAATSTAFRVGVLVALTFLGWVTFLRTVQTSIDDVVFSNRIEAIRDIYADRIPDFTSYSASVRVRDGFIEAATARRSQRLVTVSGTIAVLTSMLFAAAAAVLLSATTASLALAVVAAALFTVAGSVALLAHQGQLWRKSDALPLHPQKNP